MAQSYQLRLVCCSSIAKLVIMRLIITQYFISYWHGLVRKELMGSESLPLSFLTVDQHFPSSRCGAAPKVEHKLGPRHSDSSPISPLILIASDQVRNFASIFNPQSHLTRSGFKTKQRIGKSNLIFGVRMIGSCYLIFGVVRSI